jgi:hypothetical protein
VGITHGGVVAARQELRLVHGARARMSGMNVARVAAATFIAETCRLSAYVR